MLVKSCLCIVIQVFVSFVSFMTLKSFDYQTDNSLFKNLSLNSTNTWHELNIDNSYLENQKTAWIGSIIFKSKNALKLEQLCLKWEGTFINTNKISASLYTKKEKDEILIPIEKNLVVDGEWNKTEQEITFKLDEKIIAINKYYLVVSFPEKIKPNLQKGSFNVCNNDLLIHKN